MREWGQAGGALPASAAASTVCGLLLRVRTQQREELVDCPSHERGVDRVRGRGVGGGRDAGRRRRRNAGGTRRVCSARICGGVRLHGRERKGRREASEAVHSVRCGNVARPPHCEWARCSKQGCTSRRHWRGPTSRSANAASRGDGAPSLMLAVLPMVKICARAGYVETPPRIPQGVRVKPAASGTIVRHFDGSTISRYCTRQKAAAWKRMRGDRRGYNN